MTAWAERVTWDKITFGSPSKARPEPASAAARVFYYGVGRSGETRYISRDCERSCGPPIDRLPAAKRMVPARLRFPLPPMVNARRTNAPSRLPIPVGKENGIASVVRHKS